MRFKTLYIEDEQYEFLEGVDNASALIRELLQGYIDAQKPQTVQEKEKKLAELKAKYAYEQELEKINNEFNVTRD